MTGLVHPGPGIWGSVNDVYSHWLFIILVAACLTVWTVRTLWPLRRAGHEIRKTLNVIRRTLQQTGEAPEVAQHYQRLLAEFSKDPTLGDSWLAMDRTLLPPARGGGIYRQTVPAREFFSLDLLGLVGADLRGSRAHANALVGVGLVLTFLGLVLALKVAGGSLGAGEPNQVQAGLATLLGTAATKFSFSVIALALSLGSAAWVRRDTRRVEHCISLFIAALDRRLPPLTPQEVASETQALLRGDSDGRHAETERLAEILADRFDQALNERLKEAIEPLSAAITRLTGFISDSNRRALEGMAEHFLERLEASSGTQIRAATTAMERVGGHVGALAETLAKVRDGLAGAGEEAAKSLTQAASDGARGIADAATKASVALLAIAPEWERSNGRSASLLRDGLLEGTSALRSAIEVTGEALEEKFSLAAGTAGDRLQEGARKVEERLARAATDAGREIRGAGGAMAAAGSAAAAAVMAGVDGASTRLGEAATKIKDAASDAGREVREAGGAVAAAGSAAATALTAGVDGASTRLGEAATKIKDSASEFTAQTRMLGVGLRGWQSAAGEASLLVSRAATMLDTAASKMTEAPTPQDVIEELRATVARLSTMAAMPEGAVSNDAEATVPDSVAAGER